MSEGGWREQRKAGMAAIAVAAIVGLALWFAVDRLHADGLHDAELARITEAQAQPLIERAIDELLASPSA